MKTKLQPEDRVITALQAIKVKLIELGSEVDKWQDYIEKARRNKRDT